MWGAAHHTALSRDALDFPRLFMLRPSINGEGKGGEEKRRVRRRKTRRRSQTRPSGHRPLHLRLLREDAFHGASFDFVFR